MASPHTEQTATEAQHRKRIIVCCDGTWMNSDKGYEKPGFFSKGGLQYPSNVTRLSRSFRKHCSDHTTQVVYYQAGVGTGTTLSDSITGGAFGVGVAEHIREVYSFLCANYDDGDEIVLLGFSRGAFTARSVGGMIGSLGLLTRRGMDDFYAIFKDVENAKIANYKDEFPERPFGLGKDGQPVPKPQRGPESGFESKYRDMLLARGLSREVEKSSGKLITVKAVACFDTVGSLGIPKVSWWPWKGSNDEYMFYDTSLSHKIEHAFQALALDETRGPFSPAVWERLDDNEKKTDLRQVWFPGGHANVGGGWPDQGVANITMAWMMDQLASVGVEFDEAAVDVIFQKAVEWYRGPENKPLRASMWSSPLAWAVPELFEPNSPVRPFGLGAIRKATSAIYALAGRAPRTPGMYHRVDPFTAREDPDALLTDTNERVHGSVRVRLACDGLGLDDGDVWGCEALKGKWKLAPTESAYPDPVAPDAAWGPAADKMPAEYRTIDNGLEPGQRWVWKWQERDVAGGRPVSPQQAEKGKVSTAAEPLQKVLVEEPAGPFERYLIYLGDRERGSFKGSVIDYSRRKDWSVIPQWFEGNRVAPDIGAALAEAATEVDRVGGGAGPSGSNSSL